MAHSDFLTSVPPHFVSFAWQYHFVALVDLKRGRRARPSRWIWSAGPTRQCTSGNVRRSQVPGESDDGMPCSPTPVGPPSKSSDWTGVAFRTDYNVGSHTWSFRGSITRPTVSLSTLRSQDYSWTTQDSLPVGTSLTGRVATRGTPKEVWVSFHLSVDVSSFIPPQAFMAHNRWIRRGFRMV